VAEERPVVWSDRALADLEAAYAYFLEKSPSYAVKFLDRVEDAADSLATLSDRGHVVPELAVLTVRELIVEQHRLVYEVGPREVSILRLLHGRRDFKSSWKSQP
jgi:plasmid stabilization system protein ParE